MLPVRSFHRPGAVAGAAVVLAAAAATSGAAAAHAATLTNHRLPGVQISISCLSAHLCVSVGNNEKSVGDVLTLRDGVVKKVAVVHGSDQVQAVSCAGAAGCVALGRTNSGAGVQIITIGKRGTIAHSVHKSLPAGVSLNQIACPTLRSCQLVGTQFFSTPIAIEVGTWNGRKLTLHRVAGVHGSSSLGLSAIACHGSSCLAVGSAEVGHPVAVVVPIHHGKPSKARKTSGETFSAVACPTASRCYAAGYDSKGGIIVTLTKGSVASKASLTPDLAGIACHGSTCTAVGEELPPVSESSTAAFYGTITAFDRGKLGSTTAVPTSNGYLGVAQPSSRFFAVGGLQHHDASEVTAG